ncbi:hypothetical protein V8C40DRAFT_253046 [Trichoderma camerunense]
MKPATIFLNALLPLTATAWSLTTCTGNTGCSSGCTTHTGSGNGCVATGGGIQSFVMNDACGSLNLWEDDHCGQIQITLDPDPKFCYAPHYTIGSFSYDC